MSDQNIDNQSFDDFLKNLLKEDSNARHYPLNVLFQQRLAQLDITANQARNIMEIEQSTLSGILAGEAKKIDFVTILKLADFLDLSKEMIVEKYFDLITKAYSDDLLRTKKKSFIISNFNLPSLKKMGLIDSITDFEAIEKRINQFFGYKDIFEYQAETVTAAFSSGKRTTNAMSLETWYKIARLNAKLTPNSNPYDRDGLKKFFPQMRWYSLNVDTGLITVIRHLYKLGITVLIIPKYSSDFHNRGATFHYNKQPYIILTKYTNYYSTLWFTLLHELYHILYDWDEILKEQYHVSGATQSHKINEQDADRFARQYLFSDDKMTHIKPHIHELRYVKRFAEDNHVHPGIIYNFYCWDENTETAYKTFDKNMTPDLHVLLEYFKFEDLLKLRPIPEVASERNPRLFNSEL